MSYTSQPTNTRSMNGIISYDDGSGGILENGVLTADHSDSTTSNIDTLTVNTQLNLIGNIYANALTITPTWVSYLYGLTGNIQTQISSVSSAILSTANTWTARQTFGNGGLTQYLNTNTVYPTRGSTSAGAIMGHTSDTKALHIVNTNSNLTSYENSFMFDKQDTSTSLVNLMRVTNDGNLYLPYSLGANSLAYYLNAKQDVISSSNRLSATLIGANGDVSDTEYGYLSNVTSDIQGQFSAKQDTINSSNRLSATLIGANGNVSDTEYGYLDGVTSNIQTQINSVSTALLTTINTWTQYNEWSATSLFASSLSVNGTFNANGNLNCLGDSTLNRQYVTVAGITTDTTYTSSDLPSYVTCNTAGVTVTLPTASSIGSGFIVTIVNTSTSGDLTVDSTSNFRYNTKSWPDTGGSVVNNSTALVLEPCQTLRLLANPTVWSII